ncbi:TetR/AcrR family transcriptional regulator, partial [Streptomyces sp. NPDC059590]|uniref:TetR/AcrR family transcriptional regulator n=1 Tax=Streptomyces sp. NPDC059590 TaxID=3346877 RepID=UPI0036B77CD9
MSADAHTTAVPTLRQRRRAVATQEIVEAAESYIAEHGPHALSLRGVARNLGMTVQGLYHYFPNRDALVTVLVTKAYEDLAAAGAAGRGGAPPPPRRQRGEGGPGGAEDGRPHGPPP